MCRPGRAPRTLPHLWSRGCACGPTFRGRAEPVCSPSTAASSGSLRYAHWAVLRSVSTFAWSRALPLLALPGCLVSFNDYPLGDPQVAPASSAGETADVGPANSTLGGTTSVSSNPLLIDDFEDGDSAILQRQGRRGSWYVA